MSISNRQTLNEIFQQFVPSELALERRSRATCAEWDSLAQLQLILALEQEFGVSFSDEESIALNSYVVAEFLLQQHGVAFD